VENFHKRTTRRVSLNFLKQFKDFKKFKCLHNIQRRHFKGENNTWYRKFIIKFYNDERFNKIYQSWLKTNNKLLKPSIDHIIPVSKGGTNELKNIRITTVIENRVRGNLSLMLWNRIKANQEYFFGGFKPLS